MTLDCKVIENRILSKDARYLVFQYSPDYIPGQLVTLYRGEQSRLYSLAGPPGANLAHVLYTVVDEGVFSPWLASLSEGSILSVSQPHGQFRPQGQGEVWICNGTGLAPFISFLMSRPLLESVALYHGARTLEGFYFRPLLERFPLLEYLPCCTQESDGFVWKGRLTERLESQPLRSDLTYQICGSSPMIIQVRDILLAAGVPFSNILSEYYY